MSLSRLVCEFFKYYIEDLKQYLVYIRKWGLFKIPKEWTSKKAITEIIAKIDLNDDYTGENYKNIRTLTIK